MNKQVRYATMNEINKVLPPLLELRPHLGESKLRQLLGTAFKDGYQLIYIGDYKLAYSILGFRIVNFVFSGKTLKVDDLATLSGHERKGYATQLFNWVKKHARKQCCDHIALDSGFSRRDAHRFYLNQGLVIESFHFGRKIPELQQCQAPLKISEFRSGRLNQYGR